MRLEKYEILIKSFDGTVSLLPRTRLLIKHKIGSCAIAIKYIDGKFSKAISRKVHDV